MKNLWLMFFWGMWQWSVQAQSFVVLRNLSPSDGINPQAGLTLYGGALYGTSSGGGNLGNGTLFKINPDGTGYTVLKNFTEIDGYRGSGASGDLIISGNVIYGTTQGNVSTTNVGTVFRINADGTGYAALKIFHSGDQDGKQPVAGLALVGNTLFGTAVNGGSWGNGTIFSVNTDGSGFTVLKNFLDTSASFPQGRLIASGNVLFGTTSGGGGAGYSGCVFKINTDGTGFTILKHFAVGDGWGPLAGLTLWSNVLYGTTYYGGNSDNGTIFKINTDGSGYTVLKYFGGSDGRNSIAGLILASNVLYGTTYLGGNSGIGTNGTLFKINTDGSGYTVLKNLTSSEGVNPVAGLTSFGNALFGTTGNGGSFSGGTVFALNIGSPQPSVTITPCRVSLLTANVKQTDAIDASVVPVANSATLATATPLGLGVAADDVTPVLFQFKGTPTNYTIQATHNSTSYNGSLASHLFVLQNGAWQPTTNLTIVSSNTPVYAYLSGLTWSDFTGTPANGVTVTINLFLPGGDTPISSTNFLVGPPPLVLVHGIKSSADTWSSTFKSIVASNYPPGFLVPITYGKGLQEGVLNELTWPNFVMRFDQLSQFVDAALVVNLETSLKNNWAFTRYDVVGHSQGGVLTRMLCQSVSASGASPFTLSVTPVVSQQNFYRGRFRRVVTIGSPQNGSLIEWYINQMLLSSQTALGQIALYGISSLAPDKFDPFGQQIREINNSSLPVDPRIKFNCIQTAIASGSPPSLQITNNPPTYNLIGLAYPTSLYGKSRGEVILTNGSDGVVDYDSQGGGAGTPTTRIILPSISHARPEALFGVSSEETQTTSPEVASAVRDLLRGPANRFGAFILPALRTGTELQTYISALNLNTNTSLVVQDTPDMIHFSPQPRTPTTNVSLYAQVPAAYPNAGPINWSVTVFGTNGFNASGASLLVNNNDSRIVTVSYDLAVKGQVVLYASYITTNGSMVFAKPFVVYSNPAGTVLSGIELDPPSATLSPGDVLSTGVWGDYTNGMRSLLFVSSGQVSYASSNPKVAAVDANGRITMNAFGASTIFAIYNGLSAQTVITSTVPSITSFSGIRNTNKTFQLSFTGTVGTTNVIEASTNLVNWVPVAMLFNTNGFLQFLDVTASNYPVRFYRVKITNAGSTSIQPFIWISSQSRLTNGAFQLSLTGTAGKTNIVQASTNLTSWTPVQTFLNTNGTLYYVDQSATNAKQKFYRVVIPQ